MRTTERRRDMNEGEARFTSIVEAVLVWMLVVLAALGALAFGAEVWRQVKPAKTAEHRHYERNFRNGIYGDELCGFEPTEDNRKGNGL